LELNAASTGASDSAIHHNDGRRLWRPIREHAFIGRGALECLKSFSSDGKRFTLALCGEIRKAYSAQRAQTKCDDECRLRHESSCSFRQCHQIQRTEFFPLFNRKVGAIRSDGSDRAARRNLANQSMHPRCSKMTSRIAQQEMASGCRSDSVSVMRTGLSVGA
jgi:hypothetical protein